MSPRHHPSVDVLTAYSAGGLEPGFGLVVGAHVEGCATCRATVATLEAASGAALERMPEVELASDALTRVMARLNDAPSLAPARDVRSFIERLPLKRRKWVAPGVWVAAVDTHHAKDNRVYLLSVGPGMTTARHAHTGAEFCAVLKGAYRDELGLFAAGDFVAAEGDFSHQPMVEGDAACVCLFATEGRLKPQGLIGRIAFSLADV